MVWMTAFHFCFDLQYFGYLHTNFYDNPVWTLQRMAIVSLAELRRISAPHCVLAYKKTARHWSYSAFGDGPQHSRTVLTLTP